MNERVFHRILQFRRLIPGASAIQRYRSNRQYMSRPRDIFAINFRNPLGLSGMDHDGKFFNQLSDFGFGFVAIGPFSTKDNRSSILSAVREIRSAPVRTVLAASLSRDPSHTDEEDILEDYLIPFTLLYDFVDMVIVDMFAPEPESITDILDELLSLRICYENHLPIILRIPRKLQGDDLKQTLDFAMLSGIDGIIMTGVEGVKIARQITKGRVPVIGSLMKKTPEEAAAMLELGADLIEIDGKTADNCIRLPRAIMKYLSANQTQP